MDHKVVIEGEAPETDSEDETGNGCTAEDRALDSAMSKSVQGASVEGEASESDDEHGASVSSAVSAIAHHHQHPPQDKFSSLLHKKLKERNRSLALNVQAACCGSVAEAVKTIHAADGQLLRSQVALQTAIGSLRHLNQHALQLSASLTSIQHDNFFSNVRLLPVNTSASDT